MHIGILALRLSLPGRRSLEKRQRTVDGREMAAIRERL